MNKQRRIRIVAVLEQLDKLKTEVESIRDDEQEYFDNMPESMQDGTKGETAQAAIDALDDLVSTLEDAGQEVGQL